jgi:hypothetical protein
MTISIQHKRSSVPAKVPATTDLLDAEFAYNINDGKLYAKKTVSSVDSIIEIGAVKSVAGKTGVVTLASGDVVGDAPLASPALTGTPTAPTPTTSDNSTTIATTAYVKAQPFVLTSTLAQPSGVATLDGSGKLLTSQLPPSIVGAVVYQGVWNASTNSPALTSGSGTKGWYYKVSVAGSTTIDGNSQWNIGDMIIFNGTTWDKIDGISSEVISVFGRTGVVVLTASDVTTALGTVDGGSY